MLSVKRCKSQGTVNNMEKQVSLDLHGITFYITVEYEDHAVCGVVDVRTAPNEKPLKCDTEVFYNDLEGELQRALEDELQAEKDAYYDMVFEQKREEKL